MTVASIALLSVVVAALAVYWTAFNRHLLAMAHLRGRSIAVDWDINLGNLSKGGVSYVSASPGYGRDLLVGPEDLQALTRLKHVRSLSLGALPRLREDDFYPIADLGELEELDLSRQATDYDPSPSVNPLGDKVLDHVAGLTRLKSLGLAGTGITDAGLAKLANLKALEMLDLDGTLVSNAGLDALVGLKGLKTLRVEKTRVTRKGATRFQQKRPDVEVIRETEIIDDAGALP